MDIDEIYEKYMPCSRDIIAKIGTPAFLSQDSNGFKWDTRDDTLNGYIGKLPWWAFDRDINQDCLLYQVDSTGKLYLLQIMHILKIKTRLNKYVITYKLDSRHAKVNIYCVPHGLRFNLGLKSMCRR